ncbi:MAG TPA: metalloregulator ArsR/SmtB family transcription factor [Terriglobales bacterium]|nr:metalloregulator ArsR/SmtB family transcription factor [Terriglobales bacterium]
MSQVFAAISDPTRRELLDLLAEREYAVNDLVSRFEVSQPAVSHHLRILREAGLVKKRRAGRQRLYRLKARPLREVYDWVAHYERFWTEKLDALGEHLRRIP